MIRAIPEPSVLHWQTAIVSLGCALVAWSPQGVCAVLLGDGDAALLAELRQCFPNRVLQREDTPHPWASVVWAQLDGVPAEQTPVVSVPLDVGGTPFQQVVWAALRQIPSGQSVSYSELAQRVGRPRAVRAVASACAANAVAVLIPCHRVVRRDGSLSGYRWGLARKQALLARETSSC